MNRRAITLRSFLFLTSLALAVGVATLASVASAQPGQAMKGRRAMSPEGDARVAGAIPTVDAMAAAISATPAERAALAEARLAWIEALAERRDPRPGDRPHHGASMQPPVMVFLTHAGTTLDVDDTLALVRLLEEEAAARGPRGRHGEPDARGMRGRKGQGQSQGRGMGAGRGHGQGRMVEQLDLSEAQEAELEALRASTLGALRALGAQARRADGEPTQAQRDEASRLRTEHQARVQSILTKEQHGELLRLRAERRAEHATEAQERFATRKAAHLEQLTAILDLDANQRAKVSEAIDAARVQATQRMAERWEEGGPMPRLFDEPGEDHEDAMESVGDAIREALKPQQRELFARMQALVGPRAGGAGQGRGMYHGGPGSQGMHRGRH